MKSNRILLLSIMILLSGLGTTGCVDAVREGAVTGLGSLAEGAITAPLSLLNVGLQILQDVLLDAILGNA
ncbi:MAG: hypothetical protein MI923_12750 [Phycisphaerales bacterium]|nr:hypothetical protein [Phycisphaerales bacterium]